MPPSLTVLIPVYNEERTLERLLDAVEARPEVTELVVVDDCSSDGTHRLLTERSFKRPVKIIRHEVNEGKGAAIRTGLAAASSDLLLIQDADLEYDPGDYAALLEAFSRPGVTAVYGTRTFSSHSSYSFWFVLGNRLVTLWANMLFNSYISDLETCFKLLALETWRSSDLTADRFGIEAEITAQLLRAGHRIYEVPISYQARGRDEGKKLTWMDGVRAVAIITSIRLTGRSCARWLRA